MPNLIRLGVLTTLPVLTATAAAGAAEATGTFRDLGVQLSSTTLQGTAFTKEPDGRDVVCSIIRGEPSRLLVFDVKTGALLHRMAMPGAHGGWSATTATDGTVYAGTDSEGKLFRWIPGQDELHDLGRCAPDVTFIWDVCPGDDGEVFMGTYPGCLALRYHPKDGFTDIGRGAVVPSEQYAHAIAYDPGGKKVYVGTATRARVVELDPRTGSRTEILPAKYQDQSFVYGLDVAGGKLFIQLTPSNDCLVMDLATKQIDAVLPNTNPRQVVSPPSPRGGDVVYYKAGGKIVSYHLKTHATEPLKLGGQLDITAAHWIAGDLVAITQRGRLVRYNPATANDSGTDLKPPAEPTPIQAISCGPDGRIYTGGYFVGGLAVYDPATDKHVQLGRLSQSESQSWLGTSLYCGCYPEARLFEYDTTKPYDGKTNPKRLDVLERVDQSRPMATLAVADLKKVFFGTVPEYGRLGGTLAVYDPATGHVDVHRNVVQDQSVVSLAWTHGIIVGGTSRAGGLGIDPTAKEAKLFGWDPATNAKTFEIAPVPGASFITGLTVGPDGNLWGFADQTLFVFDVAAGKTISTRDTFPPDETTRHGQWRNGALALHPDGTFYGTISGRLFRLDPSTQNITVLREKDAILLTLGKDSTLYFRDRANLWQYKPPAK